MDILHTYYKKFKQILNGIEIYCFTKYSFQLLSMYNVQFNVYSMYKLILFYKKVSERF